METQAIQLFIKPRMQNEPNPRCQSEAIFRSLGKKKLRNIYLHFFEALEFSEPISVPLGGSKNQDSKFIAIYHFQQVRVKDNMIMDC